MVDQAQQVDAGGGRSEARKVAALAGLGLCCMLAAALVGTGAIQVAVMAAGLTLTFLALGLWVHGKSETLRVMLRLRALMGMLQSDPGHVFVTDAGGVVRGVNPALVARLRGAGMADPVALLEAMVAHPRAALLRLQRAAARDGVASERLGAEALTEMLTVHQGGAGLFVWRLSTAADAAAAGLGDQIAAMLVDDEGRVVSASPALGRLAGGFPARVDTVLSPLPTHPAQPVLLRRLMPGTAGMDAVRPAQPPGGSLPGVASQAPAPAQPVLALTAPAVAEGLPMAEGLRRILLFPLPPEDMAAAAPDPFEGLPVALMRLAPDGAIVSMNAAARRMLSLWDQPGPVALTERIEGLGRSLPEWLADVQAGRAGSNSEVVRLRDGPDDAFVQIAVHRDPSAPGLVAVLSDATAIKTLEAQFVQSQKMQAIGQLAGGVAHDFNNLLAAIAGHCELLLLRRRASDPDYPDLMQISQNTNRAAALVGQLLAFSRKQTLRSEQVDPTEVLMDMTHLLNRLVGARVQLVLDCDVDVGPIRADRRQLEQVLMNLVVNARDAMPAGGLVTISARRLYLDRTLERDRARVPAGEYALICVADRGIGIPADRLDKIFEPFFTTKRPGEGTGLGLSTAYGIVKQSGGFIFVDSIAGAGATFSLYFPVVHDVLPAPEASAAPLARLGQGVVLLVEDEAPVRAFAARALAMRGYGVLEADSGEAALAIVQDPAVKIDVIVTDVIMPGLDGPSWVRRALTHCPDVRVVFVSGYTDEGFEAARASIPNSSFLPKPFSLDALIAKVQGKAD